MTGTSTRRRLRLAMIGGGEGAFIGAVHRIAARMDDCFELAAGVFSSDPVRGATSAAQYHITPERTYDCVETMVSQERERADGIDAVTIVTPNHLHHGAAAICLNAGLAVLCEKPITTAIADAVDLANICERTGSVFLLAHVYSAYPMVRHMRQEIASGLIGTVRVVQVEYAQDWLADACEVNGNKQAEWRTDPARGGKGGVLGDIGTHAFHLAEFVTGLRCDQLAAQLSRVVPGRLVHDDAQLMLRFAGDARGMLWASQVAAGHSNGLRLRIYGERGTLDWSQERPEELWHARSGEPARLLLRGRDVTGYSIRLPGGHPEGFLEAFATLYSDFAALVWAKRDGTQSATNCLPTASAGVRGMRFIDAALKSNAADGAWRMIDS